MGCGCSQQVPVPCQNTSSQSTASGEDGGQREANSEIELRAHQETLLLQTQLDRMESQIRELHASSIAPTELIEKEKCIKELTLELHTSRDHSNELTAELYALRERMGWMEREGSMEEHNNRLVLKTRNAEGPRNQHTQQEEDDDLEQDSDRQESQVRDIHASAIASQAELVRCRERLEEKVMELGEKIKENLHLKEKFDTADREMALLENEMKECKAQNKILELEVQKLQKQYTSVQSDLDEERQRAAQLAAEKAAAEKAAEADDKLLEIKRELHTAVVTAVSAVESRMAEERARIEAEEKALEDEKKQREQEEEELAAKAAVMALSEDLQSEMNQWLQELKAKSAYFAPSRIDTACEHFDLMISYRVNTDQNFANRLYDKIHLTKSPALAKEADRRCRIPEYARADDVQGKLDPGICRTFLDSKHIPGGQEWEQVFVKAVANCLVIVPLLSWHEVEGKEPAGSVGQLMALHKEDKVDNFLLEIIIANALMELPSSSRWLQLVEPIFIGNLDSRGYSEFPFGNIARLPSFPSLKTCQRAAEILLKIGLPVDTRVISFSVKEHILRITAFQGIQLSKLGSEENALQAASKKLVDDVPPLQLKLQKEQVLGQQVVAAAESQSEKSAELQGKISDLYCNLKDQVSSLSSKLEESQKTVVSISEERDQLLLKTRNAEAPSNHRIWQKEDYEDDFEQESDHHNIIEQELEEAKHSSLQAMQRVLTLEEGIAKLETERSHLREMVALRETELEESITRQRAVEGQVTANEEHTRVLLDRIAHLSVDHTSASPESLTAELQYANERIQALEKDKGSAERLTAELQYANDRIQALEKGEMLKARYLQEEHNRVQLDRIAHFTAELQHANDRIQALEKSEMLKLQQLRGLKGKLQQLQSISSNPRILSKSFLGNLLEQSWAGDE